MWHIKYNMWLVTHDKFLTKSINQQINDQVVCRTSLATRGLLNIKNKAICLVFLKKGNNKDTFWLVSLGQQLYCKCCITLSLNELLQVGKDSLLKSFLTNYINDNRFSNLQPPTGWPNSHCRGLPSRNKKLPTQGLLNVQT